jgi:hypothetical protein
VPRTLVSFFAALTIAGMLVWAAFAGPLQSTGRGKPGKGYGYGAKVIICHHAGKKKFEIVVSQSAIAAHLAHGDRLGVCKHFRHHKGKHHKGKFHKASKHHKAKHVYKAKKVKAKAYAKKAKTAKAKYVARSHK